MRAILKGFSNGNFLFIDADKIPFHRGNLCDCNDERLMRSHKFAWGQFFLHRFKAHSSKDRLYGGGEKYLDVVLESFYIVDVVEYYFYKIVFNVHKDVFVPANSRNLFCLLHFKK